MQSFRLLIAASVLAVAAYAQADSAEWIPTNRDRTAECESFTEYAPAARKCDVFFKCCTFDPLNGDKCKNQNKQCEKNDDGTFAFTCTYSNCTEMITTTTTTTTQAPQPINGAPGASIFLLISTLLPRFLF